MKCLLTTAAQSRLLSEKLSPANDFGGGAPSIGTNLRPQEYSQCLDCEDSESVDTMNEMKFTHPPGSRPLDRYTIRRGVGVGGFGEVYFAVSDAGKEVALKRIQRHLEIELRGVRQCLNLKHPNVISLYDIQQDDDDGWWVVMEYVAGENLRDRLDRESHGMSIPDVRLAFSQIAAGVDYLHKMGLVHRDLKPGNIFDDIGTMKVGDCGLSKFISATQRGGQTESVGTFHYMAPEIGRGEYGRGIDIYALGVILFEMVTGRVPFEGESSQEIIVKHLTDRVDTTGIDTGIAKVIDRAMSKKPENRYSTVEEMASELENACRATIGEAVTNQAVTNNANTPDAVLDLEPVYVARTLGTSPAADRVQTPKVRASKGNKSPEPIAAAARSASDEVRVWWNGMENRPAVRFALVVAASVALMTQAPWLVPLLVLGLTIYAIYYVGRSLVLGETIDPASTQTTHAYPDIPATSPPMAKAQWRNMMRDDLRSRTKLTRSAELSTSLSTASVGTLVLASIAALIGLGRGPFEAVALAPYVLAATTVFGISWALLVLSKTWERGDGDNLSRRLASTGVGAVAGAAFYSLGSLLLVPMNEGLVRDVDASALPTSLYDLQGVPTLGAVMAHFALLFCLLRWWRCVDPLRRTRLSLWGVAVAVIGEWLLHQFLPIPQPTGMMIAGGVAMVIQLSSPWMDFREHVASQRNLNVAKASGGRRMQGGARTMEVTG